MAVIALAAAVAYFAPQISAALVSIGLSTTTAAAITTAVVSTAIAAGVSAGLGLVIGRPSAASSSTPGVFRQSLASSFLIYGMRRVGGLLIFFHPRTDGKDQYRYFVIAVAGHRCKGVTRWFLGDDVAVVDGSGMVTTGPYASNAWLWFYRGADDQAAHPTFVAETGGKWTPAHRGRGTALIYAKFKMTDAVVQAGMPNITAEIEGKDDILDVRDDTVGYTRNAQLVFRDFMALPREEGGFGCYPDELDDDWDALNAGVCDEAVPLAGGGTEPRYAFDSYITTGAAPSEVRDTLVTCCAGSFTYSGGKMLMRPGYYVPPSASLSEDDLAGPITVPAMLAGDQTASEVTGTYIDRTTLYQPADAPIRSVTSDDVRQIGIDMPHVTSGTQAQRVMEIALRKAQAERRVTWPMNIAGIAISTLDTVQIATSRYGLSNYSFHVGGWGLSQDFGVVLQLEETGPEIYDWDAGMELEPGEVPAIVKAAPIVDATGVQQAIAISSPIGLAITAADGGAITLSAHTRRYYDGHADVAVTGNTITSGLPAGAFRAIYYDDPERAGGAVTYGLTEDDLGEARVSPDHPGRHYVGSVTIPTAGSPPSAGGGATPPGGRCVTTDTPVLLADGSTKPAGDLVVGDRLLTRHEERLDAIGGGWGIYPVEAIDIADSDDVWEATVGGMALRGTGEHLIWTGAWVKLSDVAGAVQIPGTHQIVKLTVTGAHTYVSNGVLSHNLKPTNDDL